MQPLSSLHEVEAMVSLYCISRQIYLLLTPAPTGAYAGVRINKLILLVCLMMNIMPESGYQAYFEGTR